MPTFVYMTRCDGCGHCVDICPSDIMHIDPTYRRAYNIEPSMCWSAIPASRLAHRMRSMCADMLTSPARSQRSRPPRRREGHDRLEDQISKRHGKEFPVTDHDQALGAAIPKLADAPAPSKEMRDSQHLYNEPKWIRMDDGGLHTLQSAGLKLKKGVYY